MQLVRTALAVLGLALLCVSGAASAEPKGDPQFTKRIIGGDVVRPDTYPWMVAMAYIRSGTLGDNQFCGATVIGDRWLLTAAHCTFFPSNQPLTVNDFAIATGVTDIVSDVPTQIVLATNIFRHPDYEQSALTPYNDIALIELSEDLGIEPIPLAKNRVDDILDLTSTAIGWGAIDFSDPANPIFPRSLNDVDLPLVPLDVCNGPLSYRGTLLPTQVCAGLREGGRDSCVGDSGGPLIVTVNGQVQQLGVVSFGNGCADPEFYGVYTNVPFFIDWINGFVNVGEAGFDSSVELLAANIRSTDGDVSTGLSLWASFILFGFWGRKLIA